MASSHKLRLFRLYEYLLANTDEEHPVTGTQMLEYLEGQGLPVIRKSLYDDLDALRQLDCDVQSVRLGSTTGYYIGQRRFQLAELKLLVDAVQSSKFITEKKSMELIQRLEQLASVHQAQQLRHEIHVRGRVKSMNETIYYSVDRISAAIAQNRAITFQYFTWNIRHERVLRRGGERYLASPWSLLLDNENYYLLAWEGGAMKHFRVDKMLDIAVTDIRRDGGAVFDTLNMAAYTDAHFGMFSGKISRVKLRFDESMAGVAIDFFGHDVMMVRQDDRHFTVTVDAAVNEQFFGWLFGLGDRVQLLGPPEAVEAMRRHMASVAALYGTDGE